MKELAISVNTSKGIKIFLSVNIRSYNQQTYHFGQRLDSPKTEKTLK